MKCYYDHYEFEGDENTSCPLCHRRQTKKAPAKTGKPPKARKSGFPFMTVISPRG